MVDKFNRVVDLIQIEASGACQFSCSHCGRYGLMNGNPLFPTEHLVRFIDAMSVVGLKRVRLIGGEPLLRPDILDLVTGLTSIRSCSASLSTNGKRLAEMANGLADAGLSRVFLTLPTLDPGLFRKITGHDGIEEVKEGFAVARAKRMPVTIKMTVLSGVNDHEIENMVDWSLSNGLDIYLVEGIVPGGGRITSDEIVQRLNKRYKLTRMEGVAINNNPWKAEEHTGKIKIVTADARRSCETCNRLWLSSSGRLALCSRFSSSIDLGSLFEEDPSDADLVQFSAMLALNRPRGGECAAYSRQSL